jgi:mannitol/fructose-specific phosphotransferase system IIA component (Ntr-type)
MDDVDIRQVLRDGCVLLRPRSLTKDEIIAEMVDALAQKGLIRDRDRTLEAVLKREKVMSTGMQHGVAIPHAKTDTVDVLATAVAVQPAGIEFQSLDGQPCTIFVLAISSLLRSGPHMKLLGFVGKVLERPAVRARLVSATCEGDIIRALTE